MGRPLNKKYFGNRNIGSISTTADNGIGGEGIASIGINAVGSYTTRPTITIGNPELPTGVVATATITSQALSATAGGTPVNFTTGDIITVLKAGGSSSFTVTDNGTGGIASLAVLDAGSWEALTGAATYTVTGPAPAYNPGGASGTASGATVSITFSAKSVVITDSGSGYVAVPSVSSAGGVTYNAITLTVGTGSVGSYTNQENAISAYAWTGSARERVDILKQESSRRYAVRGAVAASGENWTVRSAILVARQSQADTDGDNQYNEMDITAFDSDANEYWVLKLTAHKALLVRKNPAVGQFAEPTVHPAGESVAWTFNSTSGTKVYESQPYLAAGVNVKIDNA
jgi:hypothetical protein